VARPGLPSTRRGPNVTLIVLVLGALPLFFSLFPLVAPIFGGVLAFTTLMMSTDSHNVVVNAMEPWFALAFWGGAVVMLFGGAYVALARGVERGR
jgi:hypothetical protein